MQKIFIVGDIHGCFDKLRALMEKIPLNTTQDQLLFIGDYIDRGQSSLDVVNYLLDIKKRIPGTIFLLGNHEDMLKNYLDGSDRFTYLLNGGQNTLDSYLSKNLQSELYPIPSDHMEFFKTLRLYYETEAYIFVHAGLRPGIPLAEQADFDMLWIRHEFLESDFDWGKPVVFGHTPRKEPLLGDHRIGVDTGCVYGHQLTCCEVMTLQVWQV